MNPFLSPASPSQLPRRGLPAAVILNLRHLNKSRRDKQLYKFTLLYFFERDPLSTSLEKRYEVQQLLFGKPSSEVVRHR